MVIILIAMKLTMTIIRKYITTMEQINIQVESGLEGHYLDTE